jgi:hypothetical protein
LKELTASYSKQIESKNAIVESKFDYVGHKEAKVELLEITEYLAESTVISGLGMMLNSIVF